MNSHRNRIAILLAASLCATAPLAAEPAAQPGLHLFSTVSKVGVDASGAVATIEPPATLPKAVTDAIEANIRKLHFQAPLLGDKPVAGETFVYMEACTAPVDGVYQLALKFRGNGPTLDNTTAPVYPYAAMRARIGAKYEVALRVAPDGSASMERATAISGAKRYGTEFERALSEWVKALRYRVETVDGKPVPTQLVTKVEFASDSAFTTSSKAQARRRIAAESAASEQQRAAASETCAIALKADQHAENRQVATDSPIRVSEAN